MFSPKLVRAFASAARPKVDFMKSEYNIVGSCYQTNSCSCYEDAY